MTDDLERVLETSKEEEESTAKELQSARSYIQEKIQALELQSLCFLFFSYQ